MNKPAKTKPKRQRPPTFKQRVHNAFVSSHATVPAPDDTLVKWAEEAHRDSMQLATLTADIRHLFDVPSKYTGGCDTGQKDYSAAIGTAYKTIRKQEKQIRNFKFAINCIICATAVLGLIIAGVMNG